MFNVRDVVMFELCVARGPLTGVDVRSRDVPQPRKHTGGRRAPPPLIDWASMRIASYGVQGITRATVTVLEAALTPA